MMQLTIQVSCFNCGKPLPDGIFCDSICRAEYGRKQVEMQRGDAYEAHERKANPNPPRPASMNPLLLPKRICRDPRCHVEFQPKRKDQTCCCHKHFLYWWFMEHRAKNRRENPKICLMCGRVIGRYYRKYCSKLCSQRAYRQSVRNDPVKYAKLKASWKKSWEHRRPITNLHVWLEELQQSCKALERRLSRE